MGCSFTFHAGEKPDFGEFDLEAQQKPSKQKMRRCKKKPFPEGTSCKDWLIRMLSLLITQGGSSYVRVHHSDKPKEPGFYGRVHDHNPL